MLVDGGVTIKHYKHPRTLGEIRQHIADKADGAPAKVRVRERPTYWDDRLRARRSRHKFKHRSRR